MHQIVKMLLSPEFAWAHLPVIFALLETRSWDVQKLSLRCFCFYGSKFGLTTLVVSIRFANYRDHGDLRRDVQRFPLDPSSSSSFTRWTLVDTWRTTGSS